MHLSDLVSSLYFFLGLLLLILFSIYFISLIQTAHHAEMLLASNCFGIALLVKKISQTVFFVDSTKEIGTEYFVPKVLFFV